MQRRTKIIATLGPASDNPEVLSQMVLAGMDVARINFSHGATEEHMRMVRQVRDVSAKLGRDITILGDLAGPKSRIECFSEDRIELKEGAHFSLDYEFDPDAGTNTVVGITYAQLSEDLSPGDILLLDDGQITLEVTEVEHPRVVSRVLVGGVLSNKKGINRLGGGLSAKALSEKDREDIKLAVEMDVDFLAISFPRDATDVNEAKSLYQQAGGQGKIVAKIERAEAIDNIESIIDASDVVMVARGDLGVEVGYAELPGLQKRIIRMTRQKNRVGITATQMMESMLNNPIPTRAEVSDVANAVMDGSDAVMLSGETAIGKYPVKAIESMARICEAAEKHHLAHTRSRHRIDSVFKHTDEAIAMAAMYTANHLNVRAIIALTESGKTALWMSRIRSDIPIYAFTRHERTRRRTNLYRGVFPISFDITQTRAAKVWKQVSERLLGEGLVAPGDLIIFTEGEAIGISGGTNSMKLLRVGD
ncbi:MAG: pyruvate kinase [Gammaproteobacteria bacterium]|nr:pyruvate kinase [Gammaproteobacteria bacterium]